MTTETPAHISIDPLICHGRACVTGTRVAVSVVLDCVADGMTIDEIVNQFPSLTAADVAAALAYGATLARDDALDLGVDWPGTKLDGPSAVRQGAVKREPTLRRTRRMPIDELAEVQGVKPMESTEEWAADVFESDEELEAFLVDMRASRDASLA